MIAIAGELLERRPDRRTVPPRSAAAFSKSASRTFATAISSCRDEEGSARMLRHVHIGEDGIDPFIIAELGFIRGGFRLEGA